MLEFALVTPLIVLCVLLIVDVGRLALTYTALQEATASSARAIARTGKVGDVGPGTCPGAVPSSRVALYAFCNAADTVPFVREPRLIPSEVTPPSNSFCIRAVGGYNVQVSAAAQPALIGPWRLWTEFAGYEVGATAIARCEVGR